MPLNFPNSPNLNDTYTLGNSTWIYNGEVWNVVTSNTPVNISANSFSTIAVAGQSNVVADSTADTLTLTAGSNVTITTDASTDSITISAAGGGGGSASDSFSTIAVSGQNNVVADSATDTLTLVAGTGITITTDSDEDSITITASTGASTFAGLDDVTLASLTVDQIYLPAITMLTVTNIGATSYRFDQYGSTDNPTIYAINGTTIAFDLNVTGHPFLIQNSAGNNYNTGLIHVATDGTVSTGSSAQGKTSGTLYWKIPTDISGGYRYQCSVHAPMVGAITIKTFATI
jgi:plastocyanin